MNNANTYDDVKNNASYHRRYSQQYLQNILRGQGDMGIEYERVYTTDTPEQGITREASLDGDYN